MRALCLSKFSKGVREFAQVIKKDAAISVGRSEFRGVLRGVSDRLFRATRRGLGCRQVERLPRPRHIRGARFGSARG